MQKIRQRAGREEGEKRGRCVGREGEEVEEGEASMKSTVECGRLCYTQ